METQIYIVELAQAKSNSPKARPFIWLHIGKCTTYDIFLGPHSYQRRSFVKKLIRKWSYLTKKITDHLNSTKDQGGKKKQNTISQLLPFGGSLLHIKPIVMTLDKQKRLLSFRKKSALGNMNWSIDSNSAFKPNDSTKQLFQFLRKF